MFYSATTDWMLDDVIRERMREEIAKSLGLPPGHLPTALSCGHCSAHDRLTVANLSPNRPDVWRDWIARHSDCEERAKAPKFQFAIIALALMFVTILSACVDTVPIAVSGNMTCWYGSRVVWSGAVHLDGEGLDRFQEQLSGEWSLCSRLEGLVRCDVNLRQADGGAQ